MRISIFGLGYVGSVTAGCLAEMGHTVVGVEPNPAKLGMLSRGQSPIVEAGLEEILKKFVASGQITATSDWAAAIAQTELAIRLRRNAQSGKREHRFEPRVPGGGANWLGVE